MMKPFSVRLKQLYRWGGCGYGMSAGEGVGGYYIDPKLTTTHASTPNPHTHTDPPKQFANKLETALLPERVIQI